CDLGICCGCHPHHCCDDDLPRTAVPVVTMAEVGLISTGAPRRKAAKERVVLLGAPASGKGTQAALIQEVYGIVPVSTGAILRAETAKGSELGRQADALTQNGGFVPDEMVISLVE